MAGSDQTYLRTRVRILASRLFNPEDIKQLTNLSIDELGERFSLTSILQEADQLKMSSHLVERALLRLLMVEMTLLLRPLTGKAHDLILHWSRKFELYNLKTLIRGKLNGLDIETIRDDLYDLPESMRLPHETLLGAENVLEMLRLLERGAYASIARQTRQVYEELNEPFSLDAAIDRLYYVGLVRFIHQADLADKQDLLDLTATLIDRQNILWLLRYRFAYDFPPSKAYYLLIPTGGRIGRQQLSRLANIEGFADLIAQLPRQFSQRLIGAENSMQVRQRLDRLVSQQARRMIQQSRSAVVAALSYLIAREKDLRLVFAVIQGRLHKLDEELIAEAINLPASITENRLEEAS